MAGHIFRRTEASNDGAPNTHGHNVNNTAARYYGAVLSSLLTARFYSRSTMARISINTNSNSTEKGSLNLSEECEDDEDVQPNESMSEPQVGRTLAGVQVSYQAGSN